MNAEMFYSTVGGDYGGVLARFLTDERILRFVKKFPSDASFAALKDALARGNAEEAFRAAHTLKGVAQNLGLTALGDRASDVTEILRAGSLDVARHMPALEEIYGATVDAISKLD